MREINYREYVNAEPNLSSDTLEGVETIDGMPKVKRMRGVE